VDILGAVWYMRWAIVAYACTFNEAIVVVPLAQGVWQCRHKGERSMPKLAKVIIIIINCAWLAPLTGGVYIIVGVIGVIAVLGEN